MWDYSHDSLCIRMPQREAGGSKAQGSISEINLKERSAECSGLSGLNRSTAPSHSKKLRKRQLNGFSRSKSFYLRIQVSRMDRIESDESSYAVPAVPTAAVKTVSFDKARLQSLATMLCLWFTVQAVPLQMSLMKYHGTFEVSQSSDGT